MRLPLKTNNNILFISYFFAQNLSYLEMGSSGSQPARPPVGNSNCGYYTGGLGQPNGPYPTYYCAPRGPVQSAWTAPSGNYPYYYQNNSANPRQPINMGPAPPNFRCPAPNGQQGNQWNQSIQQQPTWQVPAQQPSILNPPPYSALSPSQVNQTPPQIQAPIIPQTPPSMSFIEPAH